MWALYAGYGNDIREGSPGCGVLVEKERECGIRTPGSRSYQQLFKNNMVVAIQS